jgi:hypothetical protein
MLAGEVPPEEGDGVDRGEGTWLDRLGDSAADACTSVGEDCLKVLASASGEPMSPVDAIFMAMPAPCIVTGD